ncbi:MAG: 50S ribosomal protein L4 [Planctomycetaceae bacterium]
MNLAVYDLSGKQVGSYEIDPAELAPSVNKQLLHDAVVMYQANLRQGTQRTKSRGEVAGSTKKLYRQKGTGNARAGGRRSGTRRGGGHIFAKRPRDFGFRMPRKALQTATRMALASRIADDEVRLVDSLALSAPKTATVAKFLGALGLGDHTVLVAPEKHDDSLWKSARNIDGVSVAPVGDLNAWTILRPRRIVMTTAAIDAFRASAASKAAPKVAKGAAGGRPRAKAKPSATATAARPSPRKTKRGE